MTDLAAWLLEQIAKDEQVARSAIGPTGAGRHGPGVWAVEAGEVDGDDMHVYYEGSVSEDHAQHIARHDPARVLAECAAKRAIIERYLETGPPYADSRQQEIHETLRDEVLEPMAQPFADRPDFDPSWRLEQHPG